MIGVLMPSPVVHPICRTTQDLAFSICFGWGRMTALGVDVVEDDQLDIQSLLPSMRHHRPAQL